MNIQARSISLNSFTESDRTLIADIQQEQQANGKLSSIFAVDNSIDDVLEALQRHAIDYGTTIGYFGNDNNALTGIGGLHYLTDAELYELVFVPMAGYDDTVTEHLSYLLDLAFSVHGIDKVCARTAPDTPTAEWLKERGFAYNGERAFTADGREHIWHFYELENELNMISARQNQSASSDWDYMF